jgi:membrane protein implicated in regulation of membrane protease activity
MPTLNSVLDSLPMDNVMLLQAVKEAVMAVAGVLLALGVTVSPALLLALPPAIVAVYGLYRAVRTQKKRPSTS